MFLDFSKGGKRILLIAAGTGLALTAVAVQVHVSNKSVNGKSRPAPGDSAMGQPGAGSGTSGGQGAAGGGSAGAGFRVNLPPGWQASVGQDGAVVARSGDGSSAVVIAPALGAGSASAADWLRQHGAAAIGAYLKNPRIQNIAPSPGGDSMALASVDFDGTGGEGHAAAGCFLPGGGTGTLYLIAAPKALFSQERSNMVHVLQSFSFNGEPSQQASAGSGGPGSIHYTSFTDPREGAFTVDVPEGWKVDGGLIRLTAWEYRILLRAVSPDGATMIRLFDPDFGTFTTPTRLMAIAGLLEGMTYTPYGNRWPIQHYLTGSEFAQQYTEKLARDFEASGVEIKDVSPLPQWDKSGTALGSMWRITGGQAAFACQRNGRAYSGWVAAATQEGSIPSTEGALWYVRGLMAFLAPTDQASSADQIARHMFSSFHMTDRWMASQSNTAAKNGGIVNDAAQRIGQISIDGYWARKGMQDESAQRFDEMVRGVVRLRDPNTGEEMEGVAGKNYYYRMPASNNNVGIDRPIVNPDLTELEVVR